MKAEGGASRHEAKMLSLQLVEAKEKLVAMTQLDGQHWLVTEDGVTLARMVFSRSLEIRDV